MNHQKDPRRPASDSDPVKNSLIVFFDKPGRYRVSSNHDHLDTFEIEVLEVPSSYPLHLEWLSASKAKRPRASR